MKQKTLEVKIDRIMRDWLGSLNDRSWAVKRIVRLIRDEKRNKCNACNDMTHIGRFQLPTNKNSDNRSIT